ncbi:MAG: hypothetical protein GY719_30275 [bacterium]|nr:hypothetical protein [bacterium]
MHQPSRTDVLHYLFLVLESPLILLRSILCFRKLSIVILEVILLMTLGQINISKAHAQNPPPPPTIDPLPEVSGAPAGYLAGRFAVSETGAATYTIDLAVPPGTGGMAPKLALKYDSRGRNTILGMGWSLSGLSAITRCPTTLAQDGFIDGVDFDDNDKFCLDGQRLVAVGGVYGADFTEYRTENETFAQVSSYGTAGSGPERFEVKTKAGLIYSYGGTDDARVEAQGKSDALVWQVDRIEDTVGNYFTVTYYENNSFRESYPLRIDFTGNVGESLTPYNSIRLVYEGRGDVVPRYAGGSMLKLTKRLKTISMYTDEDVVWEYELTYEEGSATGRSRLLSVRECGGDGSCLEATELEWQEGENSFVDEGQWLNAYANYANTPSRIRQMDINGDGLQDIVLGPGSSGNWFVIRNTGTGFVDEGLWLNAYANYANATSRIRPMDINGDGLQDIVLGPGSSGAWFVIRSTGTGFVDEGLWLNAYANYANAASRIRPMDINGDGLQDIVLGPGSSGAWFVVRSTGTGFVDEGLWLNAYANYANAASRIRPMDVNGDGLQDISLGPGSTGKWFVIRSTGTGFVDEGQWLNAYANYANTPSRIRPMDVNGDGLQDIVLGPGSSGNWFVIRNTGAGFVDEGLWLNAYANYANATSRIRPMDINGDGLRDIVLGPGSSGAWFVIRSTGAGFVDEGQWLSAYANYANAASRIRPMDVNGNGLQDIVLGPGSSGKWFVIKVGGNVSDLLATIRPGHGPATTIEYKPITDNSIYIKDTDAIYPAQDIQGPLFVVSSDETANGLGSTNRTSHYYEGLKILLNGRGFCGFREIITTNEETGITTTAFYRQDHPYKSMPFRKEVRLADGTLISRTEDTWSVTTFDNFPNERYFPYVGQSVVEEYEIDGGLINTTTTGTVFDTHGNPSQTTIDQSNGHTETTTNTYSDDPTNWFLGRLTRTEVTKEAPGQPPLIRTSSFAYNPGTGLLEQETIEPAHPTLRKTKTYTYDAYGNILTSTVSGPYIAQRTHTSIYDPRGQFVIQTANELGYSETKVYDPRHGKIASLTGPNGLTTIWEYDHLGRQTLESRPDGTESRNLTLKADAASPAGATYFVRTDSSGASPNIVYYDLLNRPIRSESSGFDGTKIFVDTEYNTRGLVERLSEPYFSGDIPRWAVYAYDVLGRVITETAPGDRVTATAYAGRTTTVTNPLGQTNSRTVDARGQLIASTDNASSTVSYVYDAFGHMVEITDPLGNIMTLAYDIRGNRTSISDPDTGTTTFTYNALSELISQTDARGNTVTITYDLLGRMISRSEPEGTSSWLYDTRSYGIGKLARVKRGEYIHKQFYDTLGRPKKTVNKIAGENHSFFTSYDLFSRPETLTYPTGFGVRTLYNEEGYAQQLRRTSDEHVLWQADTINARGQLEQTTLGNGLTTSRIYNPETGRIEAITAGSVQDLAVTWDAIGNLLDRSDGLRGLSESFAYDALNRLTSSQVAGQAAVTVTYDALGNITSKSDVGTYTYGENGAGLHAVTLINGVRANTYTYDAAGNRTASNAGTVAYTSFNKPHTITQGDTTLAFDYGPEYGRYRQQVTTPEGTSTKLYIGGLLERETDGALTSTRHYLRAGGQIVAVYTVEDTGSATLETTRYLHRDHLGSVQAITDEAGAVVDVLSFDAWGVRRNTDDWTPATTPIVPTLDRGFTGHEHLDEASLIHMNGRVYDPVIGRFLSPDPNIQAPENTQNLNRYSYVLNNPLSYTDPSGFFFSKIGDFVKEHKAAILVAAVAVASGGWLSGQLAGYLSVGAVGPVQLTTAQLTLVAVSGGAAGGFAGSVTGTILSGGSISDALQAGVRGAAIRAATVGIGEAAGLEGFSAEEQFVFHQATSAAAHLASGGKLDHNYFSQRFLDVSVRTGIEIGASLLQSSQGSARGTCSEIGGGKFCNGAVTATQEQTAPFGSVPIPRRKPPLLKFLSPFTPLTTRDAEDAFEFVAVGKRFDDILTLAKDAGRPVALLSHPLARLGLSPWKRQLRVEFLGGTLHFKEEAEFIFMGYGYMLKRGPGVTVHFDRISAMTVGGAIDHTIHEVMAKWVR